MPTYVYETVPKKAGQKVRRYEIKQSMKDEPLKKHPETGEPIRRVIGEGVGVITRHAPPTRRGGCCRENGGAGGECCCHCDN